MTRSHAALFALLSLSTVAGCSRAIVHVDCAAPNAVGYLLNTQPSGLSVPDRYVEQFALPASLSVGNPKDPHWIYVSAPDHAPKVVDVGELASGTSTQLRVTLETTSELDGLK